MTGIMDLARTEAMLFKFGSGTGTNFSSLRSSHESVSGGGTASPLWRQILADVLGAEIATVETTEGAAYGAGLLAAVGAGWFADVESATTALVVATPAARPGPDAARYAEIQGAYRTLYPALVPIFHRA